MDIPIDLSRLKNREPEVLLLMLKDMSPKAIGIELNIKNASHACNRVYMIFGITSKKRKDLIEKFNAHNP
jgi:DNA-binding CsgD family transcriptional regulator